MEVNKMTIKKTIEDAIGRITRGFGSEAYVTRVLDDVCKEEGLSDVRDRICVKGRGELSYVLFPGPYGAYPEAVDVQVQEARLGSPDSNSAIKEGLIAAVAYIDAVIDYRTTADALAREHGFSGIHTGRYEGESRFDEEEGRVIYPVHIKEIVSADRLADYIAMIRDGRQVLDEKLQIVLEKAEKVPSRQLFHCAV
jgi:hypothetical protein